ncbi:MAG: SDR family NAD(P)-dependent oxidoreductase [Spirochaetes bacterium]|nr:SDR family NAD(P)-dependent oxidoreductase [Spirochaetota bacterium]
MEIRGAKAIVTGGASGIGRSLALALAREGASVTITDINEEKLTNVLHELRQCASITRAKMKTANSWLITRPSTVRPAFSV